MATIHVGGTPTIQAPITEDDLPVDLTGSTVSLLFEKPSGATLDKSASIVGAANDTIEVDLTSGEVDESGLWKTQAKIVGLAGWTGHAVLKTFIVEPVIS